MTLIQFIITYHQKDKIKKITDISYIGCVTLNREKLTATDYARALANGICKETLSNRYNRLKWTKEEAIESPIGKRKAVDRNYILKLKNGDKVDLGSLFEIAERLDLHPKDVNKTVSMRVNRDGWSVQRAITQPLRRYSQENAKVYAAYIKDEYVCEGTLQELQKELNYNHDYLYNIACWTKKGIIKGQGLSLVELED